MNRFKHVPAIAPVRKATAPSHALNLASSAVCCPAKVCPMNFDIYHGEKDRTLGMAALHGAGLPDNVNPEDWMLGGQDPIEVTALAEDIAEDIEDRGFSFYKLV
jgi:hypothetical protein